MSAIAEKKSLLDFFSPEFFLTRFDFFPPPLTAPGSPRMLNVTPVSTAIISYGGTSIPILGRVRLRVWLGDFRCFLDCNLVDRKRVRPLLGRKACLGMKIMIS